jgi:hypothetical protein
MRNLTANLVSEGTKPNRELSLDELETVSAGKGKSSGSSSHHEYMEFKLKEVLISGVQF